MADQTQLREFGLFGSRAPRYTSYPPANHFSSEVGPHKTATWLRRVPDHAQVSLYVHIPFCRRLCWFCACRTQGTLSGAPLEQYVESLRREIDLVRETLPETVTLSRLHWGGGTPTILSPEMIKSLGGAISEAFPFSEGAEFSVEIDPNEIDADRLDALTEAGMTRASIGVQDFEPAIQKTIGRPQSVEVTQDAVIGLRSRGIQSLNIDLLYGPAAPDQCQPRRDRSARPVALARPRGALTVTPMSPGWRGASR